MSKVERPTITRGIEIIDLFGEEEGGFEIKTLTKPSAPNEEILQEPFPELQKIEVPTNNIKQERQIQPWPKKRNNQLPMPKKKNTLH